MRRPPILAACALTFALAARSVPARADDAVDARTRLHEGVRLYDANDYAGALAAFREAFAASPHPSIRVNIALALKQLRRPVEAIAELEALLASDDPRIKPELRDAARREIAAMDPMLATLRVHVRAKGSTPASPSSTSVTLDGNPLDEATLARSVRVAPGEHTVVARAAGFGDARERVVVAAGQRDVPIDLELLPAARAMRGGLHVRPNVAAAAIAVDGGAAKEGDWSGDLDAGVHRVAVNATGYRAYTVDVRVVPGETIDLPVTLAALPLPPPPPPIEAGASPSAPAPKPPRYYVMAGVGLQTQTMRLSSLLDEPRSGTERTFGGAAILARFGRHMSAYVDFGALAELGAFKVENYMSPNAPSVPAKTDLVNYVLAPELRVHSPGALRIVGSVALGVEGNILTATLQEPGGAQQEHKGIGAGAMAMGEVALQLELQKAFLEGALFVDVHDVRGLKENDAAVVVDSAVTRGGIRVLAGFAF